MCGEIIERCSFCDGAAFKFVEAKVGLLGGRPSDGKLVSATVFYCEPHADAMFSERLHDGGDGVPDWAMYCPTEGCVCDAWA